MHVCTGPTTTQKQDGLIKAMNKLQDAFSVLGQSPLDLPQIAVVGGQSAGKSSVLENIVGKDFLPRGSGIVTRRPLVLKLITIKGAEYAEFLHLPGEKFTDWAKVRAAIENATETDPNCANKGISKVPINLTIYSPTVLNLTLIDLPGMTRVAVGDQPPDINEQIRAMLMHFITQENTIILAVTPANQDLANSDAMQLAKEVDPQGHRTVGVLTKLDLMDRGTDAIAILNNKVIPLKHGYVPVVNRSQADINENKELKSQWSAEEKYFRDHPRYGGISERCGTSFLTRKLNKILANSIREHLPEIVAKINSFMDTKKAALNNLAEIGDAGKKAQCVLQSVGEYSEKFRQMMEGRDDDADINQISGGAKILSLFDGTFVNELQNIDVLESLSPSQLRNIIRNSSGLSGGLFIPDEAFQVVIRRS
jgi:replication fork clamp-binding protein CrfC